MKDISDVVCCVWDYGSFLSLAEMFGRVVKKCYYFSPFEEEFRDVKKCVIGLGLEPFVERCNYPLDPDTLGAIDLHCFPDIGFWGQQKLLRSMGKAVWGSMGADALEMSRTQFMDWVKELGLPYAPYTEIKGLTNLRLFLKDVENKWIKIDRFRANMETWHHIDIEHSARKLDAMAVDFGGYQEEVEFVVQDEIESDCEIGFDGWTVDGQFPNSSFQGYERKNELYLGSLLDYEKLPDDIKSINESISPTLERYGYRNFIATEIRVKGDKAFYIDPTMRMPGQTGEHLFTTCANIADVIWQGANGVLIQPKFTAKFVTEATMHYTADNQAWKTMRVPEEIEQWVKLYHYCKKDGVYHFPTHKSDEVGVICGAGDSIESAYEALMSNFDKMKNEPVSIQSEEFAHLIEDVKDAQKQGMKFSDKPIPSPEIALA